jgi:hypothetical protein
MNSIAPSEKDTDTAALESFKKLLLHQALTGEL